MKVDNTDNNLSAPLVLPAEAYPPAEATPRLPTSAGTSTSPFFAVFVTAAVSRSFLPQVTFAKNSTISVASMTFAVSVYSFKCMWTRDSLQVASSLPIDDALVSFLFYATSATPFAVSLNTLSPPVTSETALMVSSVSFPPYTARVVLLSVDVGVGGGEHGARDFCTLGYSIHDALGVLLVVDRLGQSHTYYGVRVPCVRNITSWTHHAYYVSPSSIHSSSD